LGTSSFGKNYEKLMIQSIGNTNSQVLIRNQFVKASQNILFENFDNKIRKFI
jgi:hypothetical protein